jgi:TusA-related sulfurtransferase
MKKAVKMAFNPEVIEVAIDDIQPLKTIKAAIKKTAKYRQVLTSVREVGIIEHLVVYRQKGADVFTFRWASTLGCHQILGPKDGALSGGYRR